MNGGKESRRRDGRRGREEAPQDQRPIPVADLHARKENLMYPSSVSPICDESE